MDTKYKYYYNKDKLIEKVEYYEKFSHQKEYHIIAYNIVKATGLSPNAGSKVIKDINNAVKTDID